MEIKRVKRVLHVVSAMDRGGAETLIMNVYRHLDRTKYQFDFVTHRPDKGDFEDEIGALGGKVFKISSLGQLGPVAYVKKLVDTMKSEPYVAVHSHTDYQSGFPALAAKLVGIEHRICHSHSTNWNKGTSIKDKMQLKVLQTLINASGTKFCSCSDESARFLFGNSLMDKGEAVILKNGINLMPFLKSSSKNRGRMIRELDLPQDVKILGHVGRFSESKNHLFLLKVMKALVEHDDHFVILLIGDGPLKEQMVREVENLGLTRYVRFLGVRSDIPELMKTFDVFMFPSIFEGFGIVTIEAQSAGTPCILSDSVPKTTDMGLGLVSYLSLNEDVENWVTEINNSINKQSPPNEVIRDQITKQGYNIQTSIDEWVSLYGA